MRPKEQIGSRHERGFTLLELLVIIASIGILAALLLPVLSLKLTRMSYRAFQITALAFGSAARYKRIVCDRSGQSLERSG